MRTSRVKAKLKRGEPVLVTTLHFNEPAVYEMISLMGFDAIWLDLEHHNHSVESAGNLMRAARVGSSDLIVRPAKGEFMRMGRILECGAQGIMYPRCDDAREAQQVIRWSKFAPLGTRGIDWANPDVPYMSLPITDYLGLANRETFVVIQIESREALEHADAIAAVEGVDVLMLGPGDFSILAGVPCQYDHELVQNAWKRLGAAAAKHGKHWGGPAFSPQHARQLLDLGARFICHSADVVLLKAAFEKLQDDFAPLGFSFDNRLRPA
jgi:4-hydroxy-2-oxoheptanedioate aldolase